jgi:hypothetical protein
MYDQRSTSNQSAKWPLTPADVVFTLLTVELDLTLDLLEGMTIASPSQESANRVQSGLEVVLCSWCNDAVDTVQGSYSIRVK